MKKERLIATIGVVLALTLVVGGVWVRAEAPCSWFSLVSAKDVPARCLMHR